MKNIYLTFDDGPSDNTARILDILKEHNLKGVFFVEGRRFEPKYLPVLNRIVREGHQLGLHSITHDKHLLYQQVDAHQHFLKEMLDVQKLIQETTGESPILYRPPYGSHGNFTDAHCLTMKASSLLCWDWHIDSEDWSASSADEVYDNVVKGYQKQSGNDLVILFHEYDRTIEVLPRVIEFFQNEGCTFKGYDPDNHFPVNLLGVEGL